MSQPQPSNATPPASHPALRRSLGPWQIGFYGLGSMLGAGIYALVGRAADSLGNAIWLAFFAAMVVAMLTGLTYACVGSRYPRAAGAAYVTQRALRWPWLSYVVGFAVMMSGLTSMATGTQAVAEQLAKLLGVELPVKFMAIALVALVGLVLYRGIRESMWLNILCTVIESAGLLFIIAIGLRYWGSVNYLETPGDVAGSPGSGLGFTLILQGAVLMFFSFIGFEDILNVSEEVENPQRDLPLGLIGAMIAATLIYMAVAITAVSVVPWPELAKSTTPLMEVAHRAAPWFKGVDRVFLVVTIFAIGNTALLNYLMGSRLLYGMSCQGLMPAFLKRVHARRQTPHAAILTLFLVVSALILAGGVKQMAEATVLLLLIAFTTVNISLIVLKRCPAEPRGRFEVPLIVPVLGTVACVALLVTRAHQAITSADTSTRIAPYIALAIVAVSLVLYAALRPQVIPEEGEE